MQARRSIPALGVSLFLLLPQAVPQPVGGPIGIVTRAQGAYLKGVVAFAGLSIYEGEGLRTDPDGKLGVRAGAATVALDGGSAASLQGLSQGLHLDLTAGAAFATFPENMNVEIHALDAMIWPQKKQLTQASVRIVGPAVLQVSALHGDLAFTYREEFRVIPEGATYRIYLDAPSDSQRPAGAGAPAMAHGTKVAIYILAGAAGAGLAAWGIHSAVTSGQGPESPAKP